jgi:hypothetical protein
MKIKYEHMRGPRMRHEVTLVSTPMDAYTLFTVNIDLRFPCGFGPLSEKPKAFN